MYLNDFKPEKSQRIKSISKIDGIVPLWAIMFNWGQSRIGNGRSQGIGHYNLFCEMRMASILTKILYKDPTLLPPWESMRLATVGGAEVLGLEDKIGTLK